MVLAGLWHAAARRGNRPAGVALRSRRCAVVQRKAAGQQFGDVQGSTCKRLFHNQKTNSTGAGPDPAPSIRHAGGGVRRA
jgi:hypothetical protein